MLNQFSRSQLLFGKEAMDVLKNAKVAVFGIGGVGGYVVESLARSGIGKFVLIDADTVSITNINRQIIATLGSVGKYKCEVMKERILSINPDAEVEIHNCFYLPNNADEFDFKEYSYVVDCVDTVTAKLSIIMKAKEAGVPVISAMGAGNKMNPTALEVSDIYKTSMDPLAKVMRYELRKRKIKHLKVVYSKEKPIKPQIDLEVSSETSKRSTPGSTSFVPPAMGLIIASEIVKDLIGFKRMD